MTTDKAFNLGATAAAYSRGILACPFDMTSDLGRSWLAGYQEAYANG